MNGGIPDAENGEIPTLNGNTPSAVEQNGDIPHNGNIPHEGASYANEAYIASAAENLNAPPESNGVSSNGVSSNGVSSNGVSSNGVSSNGVSSKPFESTQELVGASDLTHKWLGSGASMETIELKDLKQKIENEENGEDKDEEDDIAFKDLTGTQKATRVGVIVLKILGLITTLYFFICSLELLSSAFTLMAGRAAGSAFQSSLLNNPICGLMIGVLSTALLQSSSTSTSIVITMVSANLLTVKMAIPIVMGANIGTSVTGIIVAVTQATDRDQFRRAFSGATVHDMFNWLSVITLLPLEIATGYLFHLTTAIVKSAHLSGGSDNPEFLSALTGPFTDLIVMVDDDVLDSIASGDPNAANMTLLRFWCEFEYVPVHSQDVGITLNTVASVTTEYSASTAVPTMKVGVKECSYLFHNTGMSELAVGSILLAISLLMLIGCLILMVKILKSMLEGSMATVIQNAINADFPGKAAPLTGYFAIIVGALVTVLVQSSSVVASTLTPLVGVGLVSVERVYPMLLGANIGTTSTAIMAAFAADGDRIEASFQIALCHLFFNLTGILIWYPIPFMRVPIRLAKFLGNTTAQYRWFAFFYLLVMFILLPMTVFLLSLPGWWLLAMFLIPAVLLCLTVGVVNVLQNKRPNWLPAKLRTWDWLPLCLRSLEPMDRMVTKLIKCTKENCNCCCKAKDPECVEADGQDIQAVDVF